MFQVVGEFPVQDVLWFFQDVIRFIQNFTFRDNVLQTLECPPDLPENIIGALCLQPGNIFLFNLTELLDEAESFNVTFENPVCDNVLMKDLFKTGLNTVRQVIASETREEFSRFGEIAFNKE